MKLLRETLTITDAMCDKPFALGEIDVEFAGKRQRVVCRVWEDGVIALVGFVGRYRTSTKAWPASVIFSVGGDERPFVNFGRDDRAGRFNKERAIAYEPKA